jgi:hypothetical protein
MIFKTLAESEAHSNLLLIAQNMAMDQTNIFPEKFLFYMFSKYYPFNLTLEFRNKKTIPIRTRINGRLNEVAVLEYMSSGETIIIADEVMFEPGEIKTISDLLITETGFDNFNNYNNTKKLTIPYFGELEYKSYAQGAVPYGGDVELRFNRYTKTNEWTLITKILLAYIDKSKTQLSQDNINSLKILLSEILMLDIIDENNEIFLKNIGSYNKLIEMLNI